MKHLLNNNDSELLLIDAASESIVSKSIDIKDFILRWNTKHPFDRWWRKYYKIPFGSEQHLNSNHIYMAIEARENKIFEDLKNDVSDLKDEDTTLIKVSGIGEISTNKREVKLRGSVLDREFANLDLSQFNDVK